MGARLSSKVGCCNISTIQTIQQEVNHAHEKTDHAHKRLDEIYTMVEDVLKLANDISQDITLSHSEKEFRLNEIKEVITSSSISFSSG